MGLSFFTFLLFCIPLELRQEQRACIKACVKWGFDPVRTVNSVKAAFGDESIGSTQIRFWFKRFSQEPDRNTKDLKHTGRRRSMRTDNVAEKIVSEIQNERRVTLRQLAKEVGVSKDTAHRILKKDLKYRKIAPKYMMRVLTDIQKNSRMEAAQANLALLQEDPSLKTKLIATDESWVLTFDPRTKQADMQWIAPDQPRPRKALRSRSQKKTMLILYFDHKGVVWTHFVDEGTVNSEIYIQSLRRMREAVRRKRPEIWMDRDFYLLQDNASPHTSDDTMEYFRSVEQKLWTHPAYSPDLSPCDFFAFPRMKKEIHGHRFQTIEDLKTAVKRTLNAIPKEEYSQCFDNLEIQYARCVAAAGGYFEGKRACPPQEDAQVQT